jgi:hypothetical protein
MSLSTQKANRQFKSHYPRVNRHNRSRHNQGAKAGLPVFLQRNSDSAGHSQSKQGHSGLGEAIRHSRQGGSGLPHHTRRHFESAFGSDLSAVRVHNDTRHNHVARSLNAKAFTVGSDIFFGQGHYNPGSRDGDRLLAHELTHVLQQASGKVRARQVDSGVQIGEANDLHEQEADRVADNLMANNFYSSTAKLNGIYRSPPVSSGNSDAVIQRDEEDEQQGFNYNLLPPSLAYRRGPFGISADTSAARLSYFSDEGRASLGYQYGGDIFYGANMGGFRSRFGVNPQTGVGSMSLGGAHGGFRYGLSGNTAGSIGLNLGYGAPLLPMPNVLGQQAGAAWQGASAMGRAIPDFVSDPMATYEANRQHVGAMGTFGRSLGQLYGQQGQGGLPFGAGLTLSYNPEQRWVIGAGVQGSF